MDLEEINVPAYASYLPLPEGVSIGKGGGRATLELIYRSTPDGKREVTVNGRMALTDVSITDAAGYSSLFQKLQIEGQLSPLDKKCSLRAIQVEGAEVHFNRSPEGWWIFSVPELDGLLAGNAGAGRNWHITT
jgi:hypothetical protein